MMASYKILLWACFYRLIASQFPPTPEGVTTIQSRLQPGVSISYKEVSNTLSTTWFHCNKLNLDGGFFFRQRFARRHLELSLSAAMYTFLQP